MAKQIKASKYLEVSSKTRQGLEEVFHQAIDLVLEMRYARPSRWEVQIEWKIFFKFPTMCLCAKIFAPVLGRDFTPDFTMLRAWWLLVNSQGALLLDTV